MPNWCQVRVHLFCQTPEILQAFMKRLEGPSGVIYPPQFWELIDHNRDRAKTQQFTAEQLWEIERQKGSPIVPIGFHHLVPVPDEVANTEYSDKGYRWQRENWGTKWEVTDFHLSSDNDCEMEYRFDTAWVPPLGIFDAIFKIANDRDAPWYGFIEIECTWLEGGNDFCGQRALHHSGEGYVVMEEDGQPSWSESEDKEDEDFVSELLGPYYLLESGFGNYA